ncbi:unnamed protein product [Victoria cruziana]
MPLPFSSNAGENSRYSLPCISTLLESPQSPALVRVAAKLASSVTISSLLMFFSSSSASLLLLFFSPPPPWLAKAFFYVTWTEGLQLHLVCCGSSREDGHGVM